MRRSLLASDYAVECTELVRVVERAGFQVVFLAQRDPGRIVYQDAHQVAALPIRRG